MKNILISIMIVGGVAMAQECPRDKQEVRLPHFGHSKLVHRHCGKQMPKLGEIPAKRPMMAKRGERSNVKPADFKGVRPVFAKRCNKFHFGPKSNKHVFTSPMVGKRPMMAKRPGTVAQKPLTMGGNIDIRSKFLDEKMNRKPEMKRSMRRGSHRGWFARDARKNQFAHRAMNWCGASNLPKHLQPSKDEAVKAYSKHMFRGERKH